MGVGAARAGTEARVAARAGREARRVATAETAAPEGAPAAATWERSLAG